MFSFFYTLHWYCVIDCYRSENTYMPVTYILTELLILFSVPTTIYILSLPLPFLPEGVTLSSYFLFGSVILVLGLILYNVPQRSNIKHNSDSDFMWHMLYLIFIFLCFIMSFFLLVGRHGIVSFSFNGDRTFQSPEAAQFSAWWNEKSEVSMHLNREEHALAQGESGLLKVQISKFGPCYGSLYLECMLLISQV